MKSLDFGRYELSTCAVVVVMLAGCGGLHPPIGVPSAMAQAQPVAKTQDHNGSWMAPEAATQDLLYVSNVHDVTVYSYPQGKLEGSLKGFYLPNGDCADKKGDV